MKGLIYALGWIMVIAGAAGSVAGIFLPMPYMWLWTCFTFAYSGILTLQQALLRDEVKAIRARLDKLESRQ